MYRRRKEKEAGYPCIKNPNDLPNKKCAALAKLKSTEKRLVKDQNYSQICKQQIYNKKTNFEGIIRI